MAYRILVADKISPVGISWLESQPGVEVVFETGKSQDQLCADIGGFDAVIVRSAAKIPAAVLAAATSLKVIGRAGIGVDNIDVTGATSRGIVVLNTPDANATTTAELTIAHMLSLSRNLPAADRSVRDNKWERSALIGVELAGKTLGILGYGTIGRLVASRALGLQMRVMVYDPFVTPGVIAADGCTAVDFDQLLAEADYLTLHCPVTPQTKGIIGARQLAAMKPTARLINCARGSLVDEQALCAALRDGVISGAGLDVFVTEPPVDSPLLDQDNVVFTPHLGASTREAQVAAGMQIARQVVTFLTTGEPVNAVNLPAVSAEQLRRVRPYQELANRLGRLLGALGDGPLTSFEVTLKGCPDDIDTHLVAVEALVGLLCDQLDGPVNRVNAAHLAQRQGLEVVEARVAESEVFRTQIEVVGVTGATRTRVCGTLFDERHPRLVCIDDFEIEAILDGHLLLTRHADKPGVVADFSRTIADLGVNIIRMHLGPAGEAGKAMAIIGLDRPLEDDALRTVGASDAIELVLQLTLQSPRKN